MLVHPLITPQDRQAKIRHLPSYAIDCRLPHGESWRLTAKSRAVPPECTASTRKPLAPDKYWQRK